jgi:hypothetical protein
MTTTQESINSQKTIPTIAFLKAPGLLNMRYRACEIAEDLKVSDRTVAHWVKLGMNSERDGQGHLWINGQDCQTWIIQNKKAARSTHKLQQGEAYCIHCKKVVKLINPEKVASVGKLVHYKSICPECGGKIIRGGKND